MSPTPLYMYLLYNVLIIMGEEVDLEAMVAGATEGNLSPEEKFLAKHPALTPQDVYKKIADAENARTKYTKDLAKIEDSLLGFLNKEDPLVDPGTKEVLAWMKQLPYNKLLELIPDDVTERLKEDPSGEFLKNTDGDEANWTFKLMEELITKPQKGWEWWKDNATPDFIYLFNARFAEIMNRVNEDISFL